ncbi:MAG: penicillin acylase family protein [Anaerolineae bacterium]|nr:penicillin acylase family protein [Candidatus Roseilinea sp.]MDW8450830.1 penicillin acylase family protein [Anaerolineae bacterium]
MKLLGKVLAALLILALIIGGAGAASFLYATRRPFPQTSGTLRLSGLTGNVEVIRDAFGVPHIYADTPDDLFRAQGFVHAQDRFFQMEFWRRIGQGRLAELFGEGALEQDKFIRTVGWHRVAEAEVQMLEPDVLRVLQSYADGVNAYILPNADRLGFEFSVLGLIGRRWSPEPWTPVNTVTWGKAMSYNLGGNMDHELARLRLIERGGEALAEAIIPPYPDDMPVIVRSTSTPAGSEEHRTRASRSPAPGAAAELYRIHKAVQRAIGLVHDPGIGSNNWVVAGARTTTGRPILANDPHLGIQMPSIWYINGLHCRVVNDACPYDVVGVTFPGVPGVVLGHNARIAWGVTNAEPDTQDLFIERPNPANPDAFEFEGKFEPARIREERIVVAGRDEPVVIRVRETRHGPILNDVLDELEEREPLALRWAALRPGQLFKAVLMINRAQNWEQFREALRYWDTPAQNFVYADVDGNIGYQLPGNIPIRKNGNGRAPVPGWTGEHEWVGSIPFDELPSVFNPPEGYIVTANNAIVDARRYPHLITTDWDYGYRAKRIEQMIQARDKLGIEDMRAMHFDAYSIFAGELLAALEGMALELEATASAALSTMRQWDRTCNVESAGCAIFEVFWRELSRAVFTDEVGEALAEDVLANGTHSQIALRNILPDPGAPWWDDVTTPERETREQIIARALDRAVQFLEARLGRDHTRWRWGDLHAVTFANQTLGRSGIPLIEGIFNRGPFPAPGSMGLVNAVSGDPETFAVRSGPSWRAIYDLGDWDRSLGIHTTGQSGHTYHPHYDDMIPLWLRGENLLLPWTREAVERSGREKLTLIP